MMREERKSLPTTLHTSSVKMGPTRGCCIPGAISNKHGHVRVSYAIISVSWLPCCSCQWYTFLLWYKWGSL